MATTMTGQPTLADLKKNFGHWEKIKDLIDQCIDIMLNHRQSGHPGGSRSKVHALVTTTLSGAMRWDIRNPEKRFADRFVLVAGHCNPVIYAMLAVYNEALRERYKRTGDKKYLVPNADHRALYPEDLLTLRSRGGLPGHAEMEGKTLFFKANTGPTGHGSPVAAGQAMALKRAGAEEVKVFAIEGEGGHTAGAIHETKNSAWGLGLSNLVYVLDWNNFGIDDQAISDVVPGTPQVWFETYGWKTVGADPGSEWEPVAKAFLEAIWGQNPQNAPRCIWTKTRKGRDYLVYDNKSHGTPHKPNSDVFWQTKKIFADKYGVQFEGFGQPAPAAAADFRKQSGINLERVFSVLKQDEALLNYISDRLVELGDSVPEELSTFKLPTLEDPLKDQTILDYTNYPASLYVKPGDKQPNRAGLAKWGSWINSYCKQKYGRPLFIACSADLAESTNIAGFSKDFSPEMKNYGWYERNKNQDGILLPQEITEFTNSGMMCGLASVNFSTTPYENWIGFIGACSTYGSFSYLKYGPMRLFSQVAQDSQIKVGKVLWIAGHSGPETAEDSRTHFGIFAPGVTQLFPDGRVINLRPYDFNEVPPMMAAALASDCAIIALHLTRPAVEVMDRAAMGVPSHLEAAKGAYVARAHAPGPRHGTVIVEGTSPVKAMMEILRDKKFEQAGLNIKVVFAPSVDLFKRQPKSYQDSVLPEEDAYDSMVVSNGARRLMRDWLFLKMNEDYALTPDYDNRWRTGGSVDEILDESHITAPWILKGVQRFAADRPQRMSRLRAIVEKMGG